MGRGRTLLIGALVLVLGVGAGVWWFVLRDPAPDQATLRTRGSTAPAPGPSSADGTWKVQRGDPANVFVGYRVKELFGGATIKRTAAGRTGDVAGTLTIHDSTITAASLVAQMQALQSDETRRDSYLQTHGLETEQFAEARFVLAGPVRLDARPTRGKVTTVTVRGTLELHGERRQVTLPVKARWNGSTMDISGSAPVKLADYGIDVLSTPVVKIDDHGVLEFQLTLVPG